MCNKRDGMGGGQRHGPLVTLQWTCCLHSPRAACLLHHPGMCGLLKAYHRVTITYRHTDATDSPMFSLAPMLPYPVPDV